MNSQPRELWDGQKERPTLDQISELHPHLNLGSFFHQAVTLHGEKPAVLDLSTGTLRTVSYSDLEGRIGRAVAALRSIGLERGDKVAIALPNSTEYLELFFASMRIGAIAVPFNFRLDRDTLDFMLKDSGACAVVADPAEAAKICDVVGDMRLKFRVAVGSPRPGFTLYSALADGIQAPDRSVARMDFDDQAFQAYTGGSTGRPKGIYLSHGGMLWGIEHSQRYWPVASSERRIVAAPMFHKNAMRGQIKPALRGGSSVVVLKRFEPTAFLRALSEHRVTTSGGVPAMFAEMLRHEDLLAGGDFSSLGVISMGSSSVPTGLIERLRSAFPNCQVKEGYGLTEGGAPLRQPLDGRKSPLGSVGVVAPETEVKLVDLSGDVDARRGEMWMRTPYVLKEYVNQPELTKSRIVDGWLKTGDLFRVDEHGFFYFVARLDDMFVCGGENLYPKEVENLILKHPDVADVVVVPLPHATKGAAPAAAVVCHAGRELSVQQVQDFCAAHGPTFAIPRAVVMMPAIPTNGAGKPDRQQVSTILAGRFGTLKSRAVTDG